MSRLSHNNLIVNGTSSTLDLHGYTCSTLKLRKGLNKWGCVISCTSKRIKYDTGSPAGRTHVCAQLTQKHKTVVSVTPRQDLQLHQDAIKTLLSCSKVTCPN